jgi:DsbC/DsbD-like thiol-disulfide interchange protein
MKKIIFFVTVMIMSIGSQAQILDPVKWTFGAKKTSKNEATIFIKATIDQGWHIYSQNIEEGGPVPTKFSFTKSRDYDLVGKTVEPKAISNYDEMFGMEIAYFDNEVVFQQKIKLKKGQTVVKGKLEFMVCDDERCLPSEEREFAISIK